MVTFSDDGSLTCISKRTPSVSTFNWDWVVSAPAPKVQSVIFVERAVPRPMVQRIDVQLELATANSRLLRRKSSDVGRFFRGAKGDYRQSMRLNAFSAVAERQPSSAMGHHLAIESPLLPRSEVATNLSFTRKEIRS